MKSLFPFLILLLVSCAGENTPATTETAEPVEEAAPELLTGTWTINSATLVENGTDTTHSEGDGAFGKTQWTFGEDGSYNVQNDIPQSGTFRHEGDKINLNITNPFPNKQVFTILKLDDQYLEVVSEEITAGDYTMQSWVYLTKD